MKQKNFSIYLLLIAGVILTIGPFLWLILTSFKTYEETIAYPPVFFPKVLQWVNYSIVVNKFPFFYFYANTVIVCTIVTLGQLFISSLAAFSFARLNFPGRDIIFLLVLSLLMIPGQVFLIPHYNIMVNLKLTDTLLALALPRFFSVFGVFLMRQFFLGIPKELDEAAKIDGSGYFQIFWVIILPLAKPGIISLSILTVLGTWRDLMWPIIVNSSLKKMTLSPGISYLIGEHTTYYEQVMAGAVISVVPMIIVYIIFQKQFIEGIASSGIKG